MQPSLVQVIITVCGKGRAETREEKQTEKLHKVHYYTAFLEKKTNQNKTDH